MQIFYFDYFFYCIHFYFILEISFDHYVEMILILYICHTNTTYLSKI